MRHAPVTLRRLAITLDGRDGGWRFARETGPDPAQALVGRTPEEAARLAPLVFNLCGAAHGLAAAAALGLPSGADGAAMARETVRDHALAILHGWPSALGEAPDRATLGLLARPQGEGALGAALVGDGSDLSAFNLSELDAWLNEAPSGTARLLARLRREVDPAEGRAALPELTAEDVAGALAGLPPPLPGEGVERPGTGMPAAAHMQRETSVLGRVRATPLLSALLVTEGPSLFVRLLARLIDCLAALRPAPIEAQALPPGLGLAHAARGLLGHGARVEAGRVAAYRILSPSAWNLAPGGLLERAFAALSPEPQARRLAPLLVSAINPCVPVALRFAEGPAHA